MTNENNVTKEKMIEILQCVYECIQSGNAESLGHLIYQLEKREGWGKLAKQNS
jgi:hypothetical protein